jgi:hypothetical protein
VVRLRLKIEINTREHFILFALQKRKLAIRSNWHTGEADLTTYRLEEILGTKLRHSINEERGGICSIYGLGSLKAGQIQSGWCRHSTGT